MNGDETGMTCVDNRNIRLQITLREHRYKDSQQNKRKAEDRWEGGRERGEGEGESERKRDRERESGRARKRARENQGD